MDAMTTSLVELCNHAMKESSFSGHSNIKLDTTCAKVLEGVELQIQLRRNTAEQEVATFNHMSHGITKDILITKGQGLLD